MLVSPCDSNDLCLYLPLCYRLGPCWPSAVVEIGQGRETQCDKGGSRWKLCLEILKWVYMNKNVKYEGFICFILPASMEGTWNLKYTELLVSFCNYNEITEICQEVKRKRNVLESHSPTWGHAPNDLRASH
jgi:hypothetical protein